MSDIAVRPLDVLDDAEYAAAYEVFEVAYPADAAQWPGTIFARSRGYAMALHEAHQVVDLPAPIDVEVAARDGYRVVSWRGHCPDEWAQGYCDLMRRFHDEAPTGDLDMEPTAWTVDRLRETEADMAARFLVSAAVSPGGPLVGYTEIGAPADDPTPIRPRRWSTRRTGATGSAWR